MTHSTPRLPAILILVLSQAVPLSACTDTDSVPNNGGDGGAGGAAHPNDLGPLCDGSDDLRLSVTFEGGDDPGFEDRFTIPYGHGFLFVTGRCDYYVSTSYYSGVASARLTPSEAEALEAAVGWNKIEDWGKVDEQTSCGSITTMRTPEASTRCLCECDEDQPKEKRATFSDAWALLTELQEEGMPANGPVSVLLLSVDTDPSPSDDVVDFPFDWDPEDLAMTRAEFDQADSELGNLVEDQEEAATWRMLQRERDRPYTRLFLKTDDERYFNAYVVDELPEGVGAAVDEFLDR